MIYLLEDSLVTDRHPLSEVFLEAAEPLLRLGGFTRLGSGGTHLPHVGEGDCVIFFNPTEGTELDSASINLLKRALKLGAEIKPIALERERRFPPRPASDFQAFEVYDFQQRHNHKPETMGPVAASFARETLASVLPTCYQDRPSLFLSYARADGEDLARMLDAELRSDELEPFRDLLSVRSGGSAEKEIDDALRAADAVVFLETPRACESQAISHELTVALESRIPVVWIRINPAIERTQALIPQASGAPDLVRDSSDIDAAPGDFASDTIDRVFAARTPLVGSMMDELRTLESRTIDSDVEVAALSPRLLIYEVSAPGQLQRVGPPRREVYLSQFFGRRARLEDANDLEQWSAKSSRGTEPAYDATVLLDPLPDPPGPLGSLWRTNASEYRQAVLGDVDPDEIPWLLVSGAFPEDVATHREASRCVADIAQEWFHNGGGVVMGGHPTFTPVVVGAAASELPHQEAQRLKIFQSRAYPAEQANQFAGRAHFTFTPEQHSLSSSLSLMRRRMFESNLAAFVCIGGREARPGAPAGVDEELDLARVSGVPAVLIGAPGGRTATLIEGMDASPLTWQTLAQPPVDPEFLEACAMRTDYRGISRELFAKVT